ncbi:transactivating tegument protein VP16 [Cervid alphaherpesvirus 2]|uniref:Tegument protein VP16 homolog n=1 Tax=Cervid alphaherpesvirus 2 TaxID=365327 RepID=A0A455JMC0_9ALPH|nr:transactivating tegument protein VP16 [Cervid alphaherpesvirus 2]AVT50732.1 transactivating tegument protein VP16 [Cervid alphaherpesvirus 2]
MDPLDAIAAFDASLLGPPVAAAPACEGPSPARFALPPPRPAPLAALLERLQAELGFPEGPALLRAMERWNEDLFSCLPTHADLYAGAALLSADADEVAAAAQQAVPGDAGRLDLNAHAAEPLPALPAAEAGLPAYVAGVQAHFLAELRAREERYAGLLLGYCRALAQHLRATAARGRADAAARAARLRELIAARYHREAAALARLALAHLYVATAREVSWRLHSQQSQAQSLFVSLYYAWPQRRQFTCLFHPVLFNHGVAALEGGFLEAAELRRLNYRRRELGLPLVRAGLVEAEVGPLAEEPPFSGGLPRTLGFLNFQVRAKLGARAEAAGRRAPEREHSYARPRGGPGFGTTPEAMLRPPSPSEVLPCDPVPPATVRVAAPAAGCVAPPALPPALAGEGEDGGEREAAAAMEVEAATAAEGALDPAELAAAAAVGFAEPDFAEPGAPAWIGGEAAAPAADAFVSPGGAPAAGGGTYDALLGERLNRLLEF